MGRTRQTSTRLGRLAVVAALAVACGDDGGGAAADSSSSGTTNTPNPSTTQPPAPTTGTNPTTTASTNPGTTMAGTTAVDPTAADSSSGDPGQECDGTFPRMWIDGSACGAEALVQVHYYDEDTVILRQSLCTSFEGPFMYMFFGDDQVLLEDTGDGGVPITDVVYGVIDDWLAARGQASIELVVVNSHAHGDHVQGNGQFQGQPNTTVVGTSVGAVSSYFGIDQWPTQIVTHDLGGRMIDVIPIPGHQTSHIALLDHATGMLLTGDTLYPGRLYISDFPTYVTSIQRLVDHTGGLDVCHVMGTHIEMTNTPGQDYPFGATVHADEHPLELELAHVVELRDAVVAMGNQPVQEVHDDFIVFPL
ncbi:MAG: MBL fold metallo-hydrolase [Deltaproteobacteria bacterium]|nr:MBL fold metallo-hydrolase [Deltaproteobacteria bacterium]